MKDRFDQITGLYESGIVDNDDRELLGNSLFYYCAGSDPTPIIAFGADYSLYIYSDIQLDGCGFESATKELHEFLKQAGYGMTRKQNMKEIRRWEHKKTELTEWKTSRDQFFYLLYTECGAGNTFSHIYSDKDKNNYSNFIQPKCVSNLRYEIWDQTELSQLRQIEKRAEYVFGHCFSKKYKHIAEYRHRISGETVGLYHRMFWYVY